MNTYEVILTLTIQEGNPRKWNWHELLDLQEGEEIWVDSKLRERGQND